MRDIVVDLMVLQNTIVLCVFEMCCVLQAVSDAMLVELKQCFMEAYDDNQDGKIDIREVKQHNITFYLSLS